MEMDMTRRSITSIQQEFDELYRKSKEIHHHTGVASARGKKLDRQTAEVEALVAKIDRALKKGKKKEFH